MRLAWTAAAGATDYRVYRRDVAAGQSHPVRLPATVTGTAYDATGLTDGHLYEFAVSAVNAVGEGARSTVATATARSTPAQPGAFWTASAGTAVAGSYLVDLKANAAAGEGGVAAIAARLVARYGGTLDDVFAAVLGGFSVTGMTDGRYVYPSTGQGSRIYVVDGGVRTTHNEFGGRASPFSSQWNNPADNGCKGHGTFMAAVAAGSTYGVAKKASVFDAQVGCDGIDLKLTDTVAGVNSVVRNGQPGSVINISITGGSEEPGSDLVATAVREAIAGGYTVVSIAGNFGDALG